jgi:hypothetical protein
MSVSVRDQKHLVNSAGALESLLLKLVANLGGGDFFNTIGASATFKSGTANDCFRIRERPFHSA